MSGRPEYVTCVTKPDSSQSWCGGDYHPFFVSVDHALRTREFGSRMLVCKQCIKAINTTLRSGWK